MSDHPRLERARAQRIAQAQRHRVRRANGPGRRPKAQVRYLRRHSRWWARRMVKLMEGLWD